MTNRTIRVSPVMPTLVDRLKKLQVSQPEALPDLSRMSMEEMDQMKVEFGTKHAGRTFLEVWSLDQAWVMWFLKHYQTSTKGVHRTFIRYIELKIERAELEDQVIPVKEPQPELTKGANSGVPGKSSLMAMPKSKASPWFLPEVAEMDDASVWDTEVASQASIQMEPPGSNASMENRMQQMEGAIQAILHHLEMMAVNQGPVSAPSPADQ